MVAGPTQLPHA